MKLLFWTIEYSLHGKLKILVNMKIAVDILLFFFFCFRFCSDIFTFFI